MPSLRTALRSLSRRPGFTIVAVVTLALGIGANTAIFSVADTVLIRALPYPDADRIVIPWEYSAEVQQNLGLDRLPSSPADFTDFASRTRSFASFASMRGERVNLTEGHEPERIGAVRVSVAFFDVLRIDAHVGRTFRTDDVGRGRTVVIAHSLWMRRFGGDPAIAGRVVSLNGEPRVVAGVMPPWFQFPSAGELPEAFGFSSVPEIWTLDVLTPEQQQNRGGKSFVLIGRLAPGVTLPQAEAELAGIAADIAREFPASNAGWTVRVMTLREQLVSRVRSSVILLLIAVGLVLLIACANVANLLLVRATVRQRELSVRAALGATRRRLLADLLVESLVLSALAGLAGLALGWWTLKALLAALPASLPGLGAAAVNARVAAFTMGVALLTGVVFGLMPALQASRCNPADGLREGMRGTIGSRRMRAMRDGLVVVEVALAVVMLVGAALLGQTLIRLLRVPTGFDSARVLTMEIALPQTVYGGQPAATFFDTLQQRLATLPGAISVGATSSLPLTGHEHLALLTVEGAPPPPPGQEIKTDYRIVTPGYFAALGIQRLDGELLPEAPAPDGPRVLVINQTLADRAWPGRSAIGRRVKLAAYEQDAPWHTVIGVVNDTRHVGLDAALRPQVYVHQRQDPSDQMTVVIKTAGNPMGLAAPARSAVFAIDARQPVARVRTMDAVIQESVSSRRFQMLLVGAFASLAVALSLVGLYGVVAHSVAERMPEMGVRVALGATPSNLLTLVLADGLKLVIPGLAIGLAAAFGLTRFLEAMLFGVHARDGLTFAGVPLILLAASMLGCAVPARRAMRVDPAVALRAE